MKLRPVKNSTSSQSARGLMPPKGPNRAFRQQRQDDDGHHAEARGRAQLLVVDASDQRVQPRLLDQEQRGDGDDAAREREPSEAGGQRRRHDDQRRGLGRRIDVARLAAT